MKQFTLAILFITFSLSRSFAKLILNFSGLKPSQIINLVTNFGAERIEAVLVSHPFKTYQSKKYDHGLVYDWHYTGDSSQKNTTTLYDNLNNFRNMITYLHNHKIKVYCRIDLFHQKSGFNLKYWSIDDFTAESVIYQDYYLLNIKNEGTRKKLEAAFTTLKKLPVDKWIVDLSLVPTNNILPYIDYVKNKLPDSLFFYSQPGNYSSKLKHKITAYYFQSLKNQVLGWKTTNLISLTNLPPTNEYHLIDKGDFGLYNLSIALLLAAINHKTIIPYTFLLNHTALPILKIIADNNEFKPILIDDGVFILHHKNIIIAINTLNDIVMEKTKAVIDKIGTYSSLQGDAILKVNSQSNYYFLLPGSIYVWEIK